jgi:hypothetical protein
VSKRLFEKNIRAMAKEYSDLAEKVIACDDSLYRTVHTDKKEFLNLIYSGTEPFLIFYDPQSPMRGIRRFLKETTDKKNRFLILLGLGLGYTALEVLKRNRKLVKFIIIEKDIACLKKAMESTDLTSLIHHPDVKIIAGCEEQDLYITINSAIKPYYPGLKEMRFLPWPASIELFGSYYDRAVNTFRDVANIHGAERGNDPYDTLVSYEHFFKNIQALMEYPGASYVNNLFKDRPAIVVATGPSLKKNIHLLKEVENSAVIVSADASLRILHDHNIYPHLVTTIERPPGFDAYYEGLSNLEKTVFASVSFVHPSTLKAYEGPRLFFHRIYNFMGYLGFSEDVIPMGMSTANMAYEVARHMGCNPIILVGNDLAYGASGKTHAPGFILGEQQPVYDDFDQFDVPGNVDTFVKTCEGWFTCIKEYEKRIEGWDGMLINATEGGARIRGSLVMPLKDVITQYCFSPFNPRKLLLDHLSNWQNSLSLSDILRILNKFIEVNNHFLGMSKKMHGLLDSTLKDIEAAGDTLPPYLTNHINESIPHIESVLNNVLHTDLMKYFDEYFYSDIFPLLMEWQVINERFKDPNWANAYRIKLAENYFGSMGQLCISLDTVLQEGKERLLSLT